MFIRHFCSLAIPFLAFLYFSLLALPFSSHNLSVENENGSRSENMETENKIEKLKEIEDFVAEYATFEKSLKSAVGQISEEQLVTLYAIFRKDARTDRLNGNGHSPVFDQLATEKQKAVINNLISRKRIELDPSVPSVDKLTKRQASRILSVAFKRPNPKWRMPATSGFNLVDYI